MSNLLPALGVAFAAFCVWFGVRIMNRRERWAKRILTAAIILLMGYAASFGPWNWSIGHDKQEWGAGSKGDSFYHPILWLWHYGPSPIRLSLKWFANLGSDVQLDVYSIIGDGRLNVLPASI